MRLPRPVWLAGGATFVALAAALLPAIAGRFGFAIAGGLVAAALVTAALRPGGRRAGNVGAAALGALLLATRLALEPPAVAQPPPALPGGAGPWTAEVTSAARGSGGMQSLVLELAGPGFRCAARVPALPAVSSGDTISLKGRVRPLPANGYGGWLAGQGIQAVCEPASLSVTRHRTSLAGLLDRIRQQAGDALQRVLPEPEGGLSAGILVGLRDRVGDDVAADFTTAGVSHIVAISGWNIAVVGGAVAAVLRRSPRRRRAIATLAAIVGYTLFAGASASVVRAAVMAAVALLALEGGRRARASVTLAWAVTAMLFADPASMTDVGFQLSAAATGGLIAWGSASSGWLERRASWLPGALRESLAVSMAAQAATLPIVLLAFGRLAFVSPAANLAAVPLVPPAMAAGALALAGGELTAAGLPTWIGGTLALPAWLLLSALIAVVQFAASLPYANVTLGPPANLVAAAVATTAVAMLAVRSRRSRAGGAARTPPRVPAKRSLPPAHRGRRRAVLGAAALIVALAGCVLIRKPDGAVHVIVLDVGQGDAILVEGDRGSRLLVDGGPDPDAAIGELDAHVPAWDRRLDAIVLTHPHDDHDAGLPAVLERYRVGRAFEPGLTSDSPGYREWRAAADEHGLSLGRLSRGDVLRLDDVVLHVLWPDSAASGVAPPGAAVGSGAGSTAATVDANRAVNDASIVLLGEYGSQRFLLTGDAEDDVDPRLLETGLPELDVLKAAHHGSATATSEALLDRVSPAVSIVSVGAGNRYGHPAPATMARLGKHSTEVLRTDQAGTVEVALDGLGAIRVRTEKTAGPAQGRAGVRVPAGRLLYDSMDVRADAARGRLPAPVTRSAALARPALAGGRGGGRLARGASRGAISLARPPPDRDGRTPA